jgi:bifunctional ADP-heptose synthase (sugar kinase/adenylyltransferase)
LKVVLNNLEGGTVVIFNLYDPKDVRAVQRAFEGLEIGLTSGTYDMYHNMHDDYILACRRACGPDGVLIVGVDSNNLVRATKGPKRPIVAEGDRVKLVSGQSSVNAAFILGSAEDFGLAAKLLQVKYIFKNQDFIGKEVYGSKLPGVELMIIPDVYPTISTTELINRIVDIQSTTEDK